MPKTINSFLYDISSSMDPQIWNEQYSFKYYLDFKNALDQKAMLMEQKPEIPEIIQEYESQIRELTESCLMKS